MKRNRNTFSLLLLLAAMVTSLTGTIQAQRNGRDVRDAVRSLDSKLEDFEYNLRDQMRSSSDPNSTISEVTDYIRELRDTVSAFQGNLDRRRENRDDVNRIIDAARPIDGFLKGHPQNRRVEDDWLGVRRQIERLSSNYGVTASWSTDDEPQWVRDDQDQRTGTTGTMSVGLSGTYDLDRARSESIDDIVADTRLDTEQREDLKEKLDAPEQIAVDIRGNQVTLATSNAPPVTFTADGRVKVEQDPAGGTIRLRATINGQVLTVASLGGETDYTITFTSASNGRVLKVSRRITTEYLSQTVFAESVYNKTDAVAKLGIRGGSPGNDPAGGYSDNDQTGSTGGSPSVGYGRTGNFVVPNGVILTGVLENEINTKVSQNNDRFRLTVQSPIDFRGAVIEGYISGVGRSGKVMGRSNVTFNFEKITLRNGASYDFAGNLQDIKDQNGKTVKVDNEGVAKGDSQTKQTAKRGGIGAGLGALIGAIAGGGKGAAIGAILGGGAGAGSVLVQGKDDVRLMVGSTMTVQSSSPIDQTQSRDR